MINGFSAHTRHAHKLYTYAAKNEGSRFGAKSAVYKYIRRTDENITLPYVGDDKNVKL